ncbi:MAG TPA: Hsp20/alpha crystallin family protein [Candidatus Acidoferrales bacterium]|nr:Hsp20/alpha crystallin family protein [Candidatus Acidoferrales bacterium]
MSTRAVALEKAPDTKEASNLKLVEPATLFDRMNRIHDEIARRAFEIFQGNGAIFGRELDDWFKAETELLHPVHVNISETADALQIEADVPGFGAKDLEVSVEPGRLTIGGKKETREENKKGKTIYKEECSNEILRVVDLPAEVDAAKATATLKNGVLSLALPKAARAKATTTKVEVKAA